MKKQILDLYIKNKDLEKQTVKLKIIDTYLDIEEQFLNKNIENNFKCLFYNHNNIHDYLYDSQNIIKINFPLKPNFGLFY